MLHFTDEKIHDLLKICSEKPPEAPEGDWPATFVFCGPKRAYTTVADPTFMANDLFKDILCEKVVADIHKDNCYGVVMIHTAWMVQRDALTPLTDGNVSDQPDRKEVLIINFYDEGDTQMWVAPIIRKEGERPELGLWDLKEADKFAGRFPEAIIPAIAQHATVKLSVDPS